MVLATFKAQPFFVTTLNIVEMKLNMHSIFEYMQTRFSYFLVSQHHDFPCMPNIKAEYYVIRVFAKKITSKSHTELQNAYFFIPCEIHIYPYDQHVL